MKIRLINFRCYIDKTFEFDDNGLVLISAASGAGKSTILMGIQFVLYGIGKNLQNFGKTSCSVELEFEDMKIVRTKRPNRLVINDCYEDDVAQNIINKKFGDTFNVTSYISQNALNSFIIMNPTEKLEFLEKFAFKDIDLPEIKNKAKNLISKRNEELNKTISQIEIAKNMLNMLNEPVEVEVKFPFKCKPSDYDKFEKNEEVKIKNCEIQLKKSINIISKIQTEINELNILNTFINSKSDVLNSLCNKLEELSLEENNVKYIGDEELNIYKEKLDNFLKYKELSLFQDKFENDTKKIEEMKNIEIEKIKKEIDAIDTTLWKEYTKEECQNTISESKEILKDAKKITFLKKQIESFDDILCEEELNEKKDKLEKYRLDLDEKRQKLDSIKKQKTVYSCPSCNNKLHFKDNKLYISSLKLFDTGNNLSEKDLEKEINDIQNRIKKLENIIPEQENNIKNIKKIEKEIQNISEQYEEELVEDSLEEDLETIEQYYSFHNKNAIKKINLQFSLDDENFSSSYRLFQKDLEKLQLKISKLKEKYNFDDSLNQNINEEELRNNIINEQKNKETIERLNENRQKIENDNKKYKIQIEKIKTNYIEKFKEIRDQHILENIMKENEEKIKEVGNKKELSSKKIEDIQKYKNYINEKGKYDSFKNKIILLEEEEIENKKRYTASLTFREKILEAESIAMHNIIDSINTHAQVYLDYFFVDNPIIVKLLSFKETKKNNKPQINIEIDYKGMECDLTCLSGGEISRVVLAFTLALSEMFNSPMLLLDECTASLDQESTTAVFDCIKENMKDKIVIIIAHQVVNGVFDKIITL